MTDVVQLEVVGPVAWLHLNRPEVLNALDEATLAAFDRHLDRIESDTALRVVVISGRGRAFCAGADLTVVSDRDGVVEPARLISFVREISRVLTRIALLTKPVIAAVNGLACAGGLELVMACDLVVASNEARLGDAHANYGLLPGAGGCARLPRLVGPKVARYLLFTGDLVPARDLVAAGLVNDVVPPDELEKRVRELAGSIAGKSPLGLARMKALVADSLEQPVEQALRLEQLAIESHAHSVDLREGLAAFRAKRSPRFEGH